MIRCEECDKEIPEGQEGKYIWMKCAYCEDCGEDILEYLRIVVEDARLANKKAL